MQEIWKDIVGYEGLYQISSNGVIRSLNYNRTGKEKVLRPGLKRDGYYHVELYSEGKGKFHTVHRLVALAFIPNPDNKPCVDHINGDRLDNRVENLRWCTQKENNNFSLAKKNKSKSLINNPKKSKAILQIDKVTGEVINEFPSTMEAERELKNINHSYISKCCKGKCNTAYDYIWKYK